MCEVVLVQGEYMMVRAKGHATGSELCCAGISTLLYSLAGFLRNDQRAEVEEMKMESADVELVFKGGKWARGAFEMCKIGLLQLQMAYPQYMSVEIIE